MIRNRRKAAQCSGRPGRERSDSRYRETTRRLLLCFGFICSVKSGGQTLPEHVIRNALSVSYRHLEASIGEVSDSARFPSYATHNLQWSYFTSAGWTSGFYPGCLWLAYELSGNDEFKEWAKKWTGGLEKEAENTGTHDLGFMFGCSFGNGIRDVSPGKLGRTKPSFSGPPSRWTSGTIPR